MWACSGGEGLSLPEFADLVIESADYAPESGRYLVVEGGRQDKGEYPPVEATTGKGDPLPVFRRTTATG